MTKSSLNKIFKEFQKISLKKFINHPDVYVETNLTVSINVYKVLGKKRLKIYFTRRSLKHLAEKGLIGEKAFYKLPALFSKPEFIFSSKIPQRFLIVKIIKTTHATKYHVAVIENKKSTKIVIVTSFLANKKYLKNFEILWRTAT